jgi:mitotic spindle assembly checkpoint protein MAD1
LTALREEHADLQDVHSTLSRSTSQTIASLKSQLTTLKHETSLFTSELTELKSIADDRSTTIQTLQDQLDELSGAQDSARHGAEEENWGVVREELHRQANYLRTLESTNTKMTVELNGLRERHASVEVLKEEKRGLERKVKVLEDLREKVVKLEAEVEAGRREREEW